MTELLRRTSASLTRYSLVANLTHGVVHVYYGGSFARAARVDMAPLWEHGSARVPLEELVRTAEVARATAGTVSHRSRAGWCAFR
jgi:hypothetical protein